MSAPHENGQGRQKRYICEVGLGLFLATTTALSLTACVPQPVTRSEQRVVDLTLPAIATADVNVRADAGTGSKVLYTVKKDTKIKLVEEKDSWYRIQNLDDLQQPQGWIRYDFIVLQPSARLASGIEATVAKSVRMRSGAGTSSAVIATVAPSEKLRVVGVNGDWYNVRSTEHEGWIRNDFIIVDMKASQTAQASPSAQGAIPTQQPGKAGLFGKPLQPLEKRVEYKGYSASFQPIKQALLAGHIQEGFDLMHARDIAAQSYDVGEGGEEKVEKATPEPKTDKEFAEDAELLELMEHGSLLLDTGDKEKARKYLTYAEDRLRIRDDRSQAADAAATTLSGLGSVLGFGEAGQYSPEGFERVLLLNYKTIAYLLDGDRRAYNVAQRAIDLQNEEREAFAKELASAQKEAEAKITEHKDQKAQQDLSSKLGGIFDGVDPEAEKKAASIKSAYVNPFGDYVSGLVLEVDGYRDRDIMGNARIAYQKAADLAPNVKFLKKAIADTKSRTAYSNGKLVHIIVADGFAPARKTLSYGLPIGNKNVVPIKVPVYSPEPTKVAHIKVRLHGGGPVELERLADVEALALRHDMDMRPLQTANVLINAVRSTIEKQAFSQIGVFGNILGEVRESISNPDMRSWMTLPGTLNANRLVVPKSAHMLVVATYDKEGKKLAEQNVELAASGPTIVYGRSFNSYLALQHSEKTWAN